MSTTTAPEATTAAERGRARARAALTSTTAPAGYRTLTEAEATSPEAREHLDLELIAGVGLVVKLDTTDELATCPAEQLATLTREALEASREAGVQVGRYTSGASSRPQLDQAQHRADQAAQAMWRAFYTYASR